MSDPSKDPNGVYLVYLHRDAYAASRCTLCTLRTRPGQEHLFVCTTPGYRKACYCKGCYDYLHGVARNDLAGLPAWDKITYNMQNPDIVKFYSYLVKTGQAFLLYHPTDPIEIGRIKQQREREQREREENEPS